jgi:hypothetical protein
MPGDFKGTVIKKPNMALYTGLEITTYNLIFSDIKKQIALWVYGEYAKWLSMEIKHTVSRLIIEQQILDTLFLPKIGLIKPKNHLMLQSL